jgi:hypothetical protein
MPLKCQLKCQLCKNVILNTIKKYLKIRNSKIEHWSRSYDHKLQYDGWKN